MSQNGQPQNIYTPYTKKLKLLAARKKNGKVKVS